MKGYIEERAVEIANYIIDNNATVRQTAKQFGISKSTVHTGVTNQNRFGLSGLGKMNMIKGNRLWMQECLKPFLCGNTIESQLYISKKLIANQLSFLFTNVIFIMYIF